MCIRDRVSTQSTGVLNSSAMSQLLVFAALSVLASTQATQVVAGWTLPAEWKQGDQFVVVQKHDGSASDNGGYIFPGPAGGNGGSSYNSVKFESADGFYCEAKHYDANYGVFETQACANAWTELTTTGSQVSTVDVDLATCNVVPTYPCGCQNLCRPVDCTADQINATNNGANDCDWRASCRRQEELGIVTSCAEQATFQISMWFGIIFAVVIVFVSYSMMNMSLDMDSLLYTVGDPDKKDN
eukprot:TRINITY_DN123_c0_g1_i5.p1 TRINITY_DN123_c0_g1~~TRINITY_DN123_c0_g1_i5.p1  ORF type:complete len:242 (+),score=65.28 TRINITY_DN123_c0_g1_i5:157-882(+)